MGAIELRNKILDKLNAVEDLSMLKTVLNYVDNLRKKEFLLSNLTKEQLGELDKRRANYLSGKGRSYSWKEVKQEIIDKHGL